MIQGQPRLSERGRSVNLKVFFVGLLILTLLIPVSMIRMLVKERHNTQQEAEHEVLQTWGGRQTLAGPVLSIPFTRMLVHEEKLQEINSVAHFLPKDLRISGRVTPEIRNRGIYTIAAYQTRLVLEGSFEKPDFSGFDVNPEHIAWDRAILSISLADLRAVRDTVLLDWDGRQLEFGPRFFGINGMGPMIQVTMGDPRPAFMEGDSEFTTTLAFAGGKSLEFLPFAKRTRVEIQSSWANPSFMGAYLPVDRNLNDAGFSARWQVLDLGRNYPQKWIGNSVEHHELAQTAFGFRLLMPVDIYQKSERAVKYAILFVVLTFTAFFLFEILSGLRIHPLQYLMVGCSLCLFYLLLLSLAEHIHFHWAYALGALATCSSITLYSMSILGKRSRGWLIFSILAAVYGFLYVLLLSQDYALLLGSFGLFGVLTLVMMVTRRIDWYAVDMSQRADSPPSS